VTAATDRHWERFRDAPGDTPAFEALEQHLYLAGDWSALADLYTHRLTDPALARRMREQAHLQLRLAQVRWERLHDADGALESLAAALRADPQFRPALVLLRAIESDRERWDVVLQVAEAESELPLRPEERCALCCDVGAIWLDRLSEPAQALASFENALACRSEDDTAHRGAARALERLDRFAEAATHWEQLIAQCRGPERASARVALARLADERLGRPAQARDLYRGALHDDPTHADAIADVLQQAEARSQWSVVANLLERRFEMQSSADDRAVTAARLGGLLAGPLADRTAAHRWLEQAAACGSRDADVFERLADFARADGDDDALLSHLDRALALRGDEAPVSLLLEAASLHSDRGDEERALPLLQRAVNAGPDDALALLALSETLARLGRDEELIDLLEQRVENAAADPPALATSLTELGAVYEERLGDIDGARHAYERAFVAQPAAPEAADALERLYRKNEAWDALRDLLEVRSRVGAPDQRAPCHARLGTLLVEHFAAPEAAARAFEAALALDPRLPSAHRGVQRIFRERGDDEALARAYEHEAAITIDPARLGFLASEISQRFEARDDPQGALPWLLRWADALPDDVSAQRACADGLERLGRFADLALTLVAVDPLLPPSERGANRRRLGAARAAAGDVPAAIAAYRLALDLDPDDQPALEALAAHLEAEERLDELAPVWRQLADVLTGSERIRCLDSLSRLLEEGLQDPAAAIEVLKRLVADPDEPEGACERLERLLRHTGRFRELSQTLRARAARCDAGDERVALELAGAEVLAELAGETDAALDLLRGIWRRHPESAEARDRYQGALRDAARPAERAALLAHRIRTGTTATERDGCAIDRAELLANELGDVATALDELQRVAATASDPALRRRARDFALDLLAEREDWYALRALLEQALADGGARFDLHRRIAHLCRDRLDDSEGAIRHFHAAALLAPRRAASWRDLAQVCAHAGRTGLELDAIDAELAIGVDRERESILRARAFRLLRDGENDAAAAHAERLVAIDPAHAEANDFLVARCLRAGDAGGAFRQLEARLTALDGAVRDPDGSWADQRASLRTRMASLLADRLGDVDEAVAVLEPALGECGPLPAVAAPLANLYERAELPDELADLCRAVAANAPSEAERASWLVRLGDALRATQRNRDAAEAYREAATHRPNDPEILAALCDLYRTLGESDSLARFLEARLPHLGGRAEIPLRMELAQLLAQRLDRPADAFEHLRRVLQLEPGHGDALAAAVALPRSAAPAASIDPLIAAALATSAPPKVRASLWSQRAALRTASGADSASSVAALRESLRLDPTRAPDRESLRALLVERGDWVGVLACLEDALAAAPDRIDALRLAADLAWNHLGPDAALPWLERLFTRIPDDAATASRISEAHRRGNRPAALLRALEREAPLASAPHLLHRERAAILEQELGSPARAVEALEAALACEPADAATQSELDRLYRALHRHRERAALLEQQIASATPEAAVALRCDAAALYADRLQAPERAVEHLLHALSAAGNERGEGEVLRALGRALRDTGNPDAWARCAERELAILDPTLPALSDRRRALRQELAACYEHELDRPDDALRHLRALLDLKWTEAHGAGAEDLAAIESAVLRLLRRQQAWIELADRLHQRVLRRPDDVACWRELAQVREERLQSPSLAAEAYRALLLRRPTDGEALDARLHCSERIADWPDVAATLEHRLAHVDHATAAERAAVLRRLGDVYWNRLGSTTRASRAFGRALEADPNDLASLRALQDLLVAMEDWQGAVDLFESEVEMLGDSDSRRRQQASVRAGEIARTRQGDDERALRNYERADAIGDLDAASCAALAELYWAREDFARFAETFAAWCRDVAARPTSADLLRLADTLERLGETAEAATWVERAVAEDGTSAEAWEAAARLRAAVGDVTGAAEALERCATRVSDSDAAQFLHRAAFLRWPSDPQAARSLLRAATDRDPANAAACAAFARCSAQCERFEDAAEFAARAFERVDAAGDSEPPIDANTRLETALAGARSARRSGNDEAAARLYPRVLAEDADHAEAAWELAETLAALDDWAGCGRAIDAARAASPAASATQLALLGTARARCGDSDAARECLEAAIERDPACVEAHQELVRLHATQHAEEAGVAALERWAGVTEDPNARARILLRAASWERGRDGAAGTVERLLRQAVAADAELAAAWVSLASLLWERGDFEAAHDVARDALVTVPDAAARGALCLIRARSIERRGDRAAALAAFAEAQESNRQNVEAALSHARLLRGQGEWRRAAEALERFAGDPGNRTDPALADVLTQLARLRAGPLEDVEGAIDAYREAVAADPEHIEARAALAEFLSHRPGDRDESWGHLRAVLTARPTHTASLRVALRMLRESDDATAAATGAAILTALSEPPQQPIPDARPTFATEHRLDDPLGERIRKIAQIAREDLGTALETPHVRRRNGADDPASRFRDARLLAESELTAPALIPLDEPTLRDTLTLVAALALEPEQVQGDGQLVNSLSSAIRRRTRKRLQRELREVALAEIAAFDFGAWRRDVQALAAVIALESSNGDLRTALTALVEADAEHSVAGKPAPADWIAVIEADPRARWLLRRVVTDWLQRI